MIRHETFDIDGIICEVNYQDSVFSRKEIENFLRRGLKNQDRWEFDAQTEAFDVLNYDDIISHLKKPKKLYTKVMDCTSFIKFQEYLEDRPLTQEEIINELKHHGFYEVEHVGGTQYKLTGTKGPFNFFTKFYRTEE
jgi:hypothetical protein